MRSELYIALLFSVRHSIKDITRLSQTLFTCKCDHANPLRASTKQIPLLFQSDTGGPRKICPSLYPEVAAAVVNSYGSRIQLRRIQLRANFRMQETICPWAFLCLNPKEIPRLVASLEARFPASNFVIHSECCRGREGPHLRKIRAIHSDGQRRARRIEALQERRQAVMESAGTSFLERAIFLGRATITR
jgi:hypothetical protein